MAAVRRGAIASLASSLFTPRNLAIAGGGALALGGAALAYKLISDHIARKREEERRRREQKQAFAPPTGAAPGIPRDVRYFGRLPESVMRSIRSNSRRGGRVGAIAALLATLATGGAVAGGLAAARKPPSAYDRLVAALKSTTAKRIGIGLGGAALGAGAVGAGIAAPKILDKLRNGGMGLGLDLFGGGDKEKDKDKKNTAS